MCAKRIHPVICIKTILFDLLYKERGKTLQFYCQHTVKTFCREEYRSIASKRETKGRFESHSSGWWCWCWFICVDSIWNTRTKCMSTKLNIDMSNDFVHVPESNASVIWKKWTLVHNLWVDLVQVCPASLLHKARRCTCISCLFVKHILWNIRRSNN